MIRQPVYLPVTQKYEIFEDEKSDDPIGRASVTEGFIDSLLVRADVTEAFRGQILSRLLRAMMEDADRYNSNLSIKVAVPDAIRLKRFLERFGFREGITGVYQRDAGASMPLSVIY